MCLHERFTVSKSSLSEILRTRRDAMLEDLFALLRFPSIANHPQADGCGPCAQWLAARLGEMEFAAEVLPTAGQPCVFAETIVDPAKPTLLVYGHYDVQPPEPLELWHSDPFEPEIREGRIYARGAEDDKGQLFMHLMAIDAWQRSGGLPLNIKVLLEGEEEVGSPNMETFLRDHANRLAADALVVSDTGFYDAEHPSITTALRGLVYVELRFTGPQRDVHSGMYSGVLANPIHAAADIVSALHDADGRVTLPGFYDDVEPLPEELRQAWANLPDREEQMCRDLGVEALAGGEKGFSALERRWARPALDVNGIDGGYTGEGSKTIIASTARVKLSSRLVAGQKPEKILEALRAFLADRVPEGIRWEMDVFAQASPVAFPGDAPAIRAAAKVLEDAFGKEVTYIRSGASIPITELFQRILGLDAALLGVGLPDSNVHSPNESFPLEQMARGAEAVAMFYGCLAETLHRGNGSA